MFIRINAALSASRARRDENEKGFTLIELLVVVLIIGILSAIAIPVFIGQQNTAKDAAAKSDLGNAKVAMVSYATANNGTYTTTASDLTSYGFTNSPGTTVGTIFESGGAFCISETAATGNVFIITDAAAVSQAATGVTGCTSAAG